MSVEVRFMKYVSKGDGGCWNWTGGAPEAAVVTLSENVRRARAAVTHCPHGHEYTAENTYRYPDGRRRCIACRRIADNEPGPRERRRLYKAKMRALRRVA